MLGVGIVQTGGAGARGLRARLACRTYRKMHEKPKKDDGGVDIRVFDTREAAKRLNLTEEKVLSLINEGYLKTLPGCRKPFKFTLYHLEKYATSTLGAKLR